MHIEGLAYCGIFCNGCPIYWATRQSTPALQQKMRKEIASITNEKYGTTLKSTDITDCDGCKSNSGKIFKLCSGCEIRRCAQHNNYNFCAECPDYVCPKLENLYLEDKNAKIFMDILKSIY